MLRRPLQLVDAADSNADSAAGITILSNQSLYRSRNFFSTRETSCHFMSIFFKLVRTAVLFCSSRNNVPIFDSFHFLQMYIFHWFYHGNDLFISKKGPFLLHYKLHFSSFSENKIQLKNPLMHYRTSMPKISIRGKIW